MLARSAIAAGLLLLSVVGPAFAAPEFSATTEKARTHQIRPANVIAAKTVESIQPYRVVPPVGQVQNKTLNVTKLQNELSQIFLATNVKGYAMQLRKDGNVVAQNDLGKARSADDGNINFSVDTRMHIASVSKLITAIATVKAITDKGLSFDGKIGAYLPAYWPTGANVGEITFRRLLTHRSGFVIPPSNADPCGCAGDYAAMKAVVAAGVPAAAPAEGTYENVNFSILRVILPILNGFVSRNNPTTSDAAWDVQTTQYFLEYVQNKVFTPAGVSNVSPIPGSQGAFAYTTKSDLRGWDSGDVTTALGGVGFRVSTKEVAAVLDAYRRKGTIVPRARAEEAIEAGLGLDWERSTPAGKLWMKNGGWGDGANHVELSVAFLLPDNYELVVLMNSQIGFSTTPPDLTQVVYDAYLRSLDSPIPKVMIQK